jgi:hypothetical protein
MEEGITGQPQVCWMSGMALIATGTAMPGVHRVIDGVFCATSVVAYMALAVKPVCIAAIACTLWFGTFVFNPKLKEAFTKFATDEVPAPEREPAFFALRGRRKWWCYAR